MPIANAKKEEKQLLKKKAESTMWRKARQAIVCVPQLDAVHCSGKSIIYLGQANRICGGSNARIRCPPIQGYRCLSNEQNEFITWLRNRGEHDASSAITIGMSIHGRALYASRPIKAGERILRVSQNLMITPDRLSIAIIRLLEGAVSQWGRLALFLLAEKHAGETSAWAPYIAALPERDSIHSTIFWKKEELDAIKESIVYRETMQRKAVIRAEFSALQHVLLQFPDIFGEQVSYLDFKHAYTIVCSRAWGIEALSTLALVPYVDFFNHNANCTTMSYDEENACAEVIADKDYSEGEQVVISYGPLPNSTLALDFGFTLAYNPHDQVEIWMGLSRRDPLFENKLDLLHSHNMPTMLNADGLDSGGSSFVLQEVKSPVGRGKGIPHSLRAFARVACANSVKELSDMATDAAKHDGRLARRPLENTKKEAKAMALILGRIEILTQHHVAAVLALKARQNMSSIHRDMAEAILGGELRVLRSIFWKKEELDAIKESIVYRETMQRKAVIRAEFSALQHVLLQFPDIFGEQVSYLDFKHAYTIVCSRAWGIEALSTLALVPYVDFFNHNANCTTMSYDEENACAEVIADKDYSEGEQVVISYGPLPNSTLALDFGFTLAYNPHDQVEIWMGLSRRDPLFENKLDLLHSHNMPTMLNADGLDSGGSSFVLQEVKSPVGRGKGIPHSLRAFARVACANSVKELSDMATDAAKHDGRLARRPLENTKKEAKAMALILGRIEILTQHHVAAVLALKARQNMSSIHRDMAEAILGGELRVLRSVSAWFKEQCKLQFVAK